MYTEKTLEKWGLPNFCKNLKKHIKKTNKTLGNKEKYKKQLTTKIDKHN